MSSLNLYQPFFKNVLKHLDPEFCHEATIECLKLAHALPGGSHLLKKIFGSKVDTNPVEVAGIKFPGHFGLAAGFDKNCQVPLALLALGFTHVEIGTVTARAQPGNSKPRSFRLIQDEALINRMGFNNDGALKVAERLKKIRSRKNGWEAVIGVNIGKNKDTALADAAKDYEFAAKTLAPYASYLVINVSSPNTPNLRSLQSVEELAQIIAVTKPHSFKADGSAVPIFIKIAPDLHDDDIKAVANLAVEKGIAGIIASNTTISRPPELISASKKIDEIGSGGLSGPILKKRAEEVLRLLSQNRSGVSAEGDEIKLALISVGGVVDHADVKTRLELGADLVQGYTALIYQGPAWPGRIHRELAKQL